MKLKEFQKLKLGDKVYDTENNEYVTKGYILDIIRQRALKIARSKQPLEKETDFIYGWIIDKLERTNDKKAKADVKAFLQKRRLFDV